MCSSTCAGPHCFECISNLHQGEAGRVGGYAAMTGMDVGQSIAISNLAALNRLKYSPIDEESCTAWEHLSFKVVCLKSH